MKMLLFSTPHPLTILLRISSVNFLIPITFVGKFVEVFLLCHVRININYTTYYDIDQNALEKKNVILGFDPSEGASVSQYFPDFADWHVVSGKWNITLDGLRGGDRQTKYKE